MHRIGTLVKKNLSFFYCGKGTRQISIPDNMSGPQESSVLSSKLSSKFKVSLK